MAQISPSILAADFARLGEEVKDVCNRGIDYLHIDVMDGAFVPNISFGASVMKSLNKYVTVPYDVHLMIVEPDRYLEDFVTNNTGFITVHYESCDNLMKTIEHIHNMGCKAGVSIKPQTRPEVLNGYLQYIDLVLVMSVEPGFGGQKFIENSIPKIQYLNDKKDKYNFIIEVDGGISSSNAQLVKDAGADLIVAGSAVFKSTERSAEIAAIKA